MMSPPSSARGAWDIVSTMRDLSVTDACCSSPRLRFFPRVYMNGLFCCLQGATVVESIIQVWREYGANPQSAAQRAEWLLSKLYTPDRGRAFTVLERNVDIDSEDDPGVVEGRW